MTPNRSLDLWTDRLVRGLARRSSRRAFIARLGTWLAGAAVAPVLLPVGSDASNAPPGESGDPKDCSYWRYCGINGPLCACNGGSPNSCPPGTEMSSMAWIGTCRNPVDDRDYLISYRDCCGKAMSMRCLCSRNDGVMPVYRVAKASTVHWCQNGESVPISCSTAIVLGPVDDAKK